MIHTLSAVNMVDTEPAKFSPLYKIKRLLIILRWLLGFPYKTLNKSFDDFKFVPILEYFRYGLYLFIFFACEIYFFLTIMKVYTESNPIIGMKKYFTEFLGFTVLDILVLWSCPYIGFISCTFYLFSFKKIYPSFSEVCGALTNINKDIYESLKQGTENKKRKNLSISTKLFILQLILAISISILHAMMFPMVLKDELFKKSPLSLTDEIFLTLSVIIQLLCWTYPPITISADMVVCHMLEETGETYLAWNTLLEIHENQLPEKTDIDNGNPSDIIDNSESCSERYDKIQLKYSYLKQK